MMHEKSLDGLGCWFSGDLVVFLWRDPARVKLVKQLYDWLDEFTSGKQGSLLTLQIILPSSNPPDGPAREENHTRLRVLGHRLRRVVSVPTGGVMWVNLVRTIMRAMFLFTGQSTVQRVANSESEGISSLLELATAVTPSRREIETGIRSLRKRLGVTAEAMGTVQPQF